MMVAMTYSDDCYNCAVVLVMIVAMVVMAMMVGITLVMTDNGSNDFGHDDDGCRD